MSIVSKPNEPVSSLNTGGMFAAFLSSRWLLAVIIGFAVLQQALGHVNCDTSWFITFAEKVFDGARPYIDISDPNPPAAFLAYLPAVWLSHLAKIRIEPIVVTMTFLLALGSITLAGTILRKVEITKEQTLPALSLTSFCLLLLPSFCFTEREHLALILFLPMFALVIAKATAAQETSVPTGFRFLAGIAVGMGLAFKPYYAVPLGLVLLYGAWQKASIKSLLSLETMTAALVVLVYGASVLLLFPAYAEAVLPVVRDIYVPAREALGVVLTRPAFVINITLLSLVLSSGVRVLKDPFVGVTFFASAGFAATFLIQSKGWTNHAYPGVALAIMAASFLFLGHKGPRKSLWPAVFWPILILSPLLFGAQAMVVDREEYPGLVQAVKGFGLNHPKIAVLAEQVDLGHPLVRQVDGQWIGRQNCLWTSYAGRTLLNAGMDDERHALLKTYIRADEEALAEDVLKGQPDLILVETPVLEKRARENSALKPIFIGYNKAASVGDVSIWWRDEH